MGHVCQGSLSKVWSLSRMEGDIADVNVILQM